MLAKAGVGLYIFKRQWSHNSMTHLIDLNTFAWFPVIGILFSRNGEVRKMMIATMAQMVTLNMTSKSTQPTIWILWGCLWGWEVLRMHRTFRMTLATALPSWNLFSSCVKQATWKGWFLNPYSWLSWTSNLKFGDLSLRACEIDQRARLLLKKWCCVNSWHRAVFP